MIPDTDLPEEVISELEAGRTVAAVRLLRTHQGLGLKEAREAVDAYLDKNPASNAPGQAQTDGGIGRIIILIIGVSVIYGVYSYIF